MELSSPAYCRPLAFTAFQGEISRVESTRGLLRAAFAISLHERPEENFAEVEQAISSLAASVQRRVRSKRPEAIMAHLHDELFDVIGFAGNDADYYNPANSYLADVVRTHRGIPISLVLVYKSIAERLGLTVHGVNAPGHFLAAVETDPRTDQQAELMYVDPYYHGKLLSRREALARIGDATGTPAPHSDVALARATHRQWLFRMLNNLQVIFAHRQRDRDVYAMQELQSLLGPS